MSRNIILTSTSLSLALVLSTLALAQQGGAAGVSGEGDETRPARAVGGGWGGGGGGAIGGGGGGAFGGGGGMGSVFVAPPRVQIGIAMDRVPEALASHLGVDPNEVVLIVNVAEGEAAHKAGLERFDVITHLDGESPVTQDTIRRMARAKEPGDTVALRVLRGGEVKEVVITLAEATPQRLQPGGGLGWGARGNIYLTPGQSERFAPQENVVQPEGLRGWGNFQYAPYQLRELREQFLQEWRERQPEIEEHLRRLREETDALHETLRREWRERRHEFRLDEETREKVQEFLDSAAERTAAAIRRALEGVEDAEIDIELSPRIEIDVMPRVQIQRGGGLGRAMVVQPDDAARRRALQREYEEVSERLTEQHPRREALRRALEAEQRVEREEVRRPGPEMERRLSGLEERLERMERMMRRLLEREGLE